MIKPLIPLSTTGLFSKTPPPQARSFFFSSSERSVIEEAMDLLSKQDPTSWKTLAESQGRLERLHLLLQEYPSLASDEDLGPYHRDIDTLLETLCNLEPLELKLRLPTKAVLAESYMLAKAQHLKGLFLALSALPALPALSALPFSFGSSGPPGISALVRYVFFEVSHTIHTYLLYQLLLDVILDEENPRSLKRRSARYLVDLWDECTAQKELSGFFYLIRSLWDARLALRVQYGTLLGTAELLQLIAAECDPKILEYFTLRDITEEESFAFQEFLFALTYEQLQTLRQAMLDQNLSVIARPDVLAILGLSDDDLEGREAAPQTDPVIVYRSYKKRRFQARHRKDKALPGPHKTAEEYLVMYLLQNPHLEP